MDDKIKIIWMFYGTWLEYQSSCDRLYKLFENKYLQSQN